MYIYVIERPILRTRRGTTLPHINLFSTIIYAYIYVIDRPILKTRRGTTPPLINLFSTIIERPIVKTHLYKFR